MTHSKTYRHISALLLLILYGFIATPLQFWHNHAKCGAAKVALADMETSIDDTVDNEQFSNIDDCKICSHAYSVFSHEQQQPEFAVPFIKITTPHARVSPILEMAGFSFSNKGPPTQLA